MNLTSIIDTEVERIGTRVKNILVFAASVLAFAVFPALSTSGLLRVYLIGTAILISLTSIAFAAYEARLSKEAMAELEELAGKPTRCWSWHIGPIQWDKHRSGYNRKVYVGLILWPLKGLVAAQLAFTTAIIAGGDSSPQGLLLFAAGGFVAGVAIGLLSLSQISSRRATGVDAFLTEDGIYFDGRYYSFSAAGWLLESASVCLCSSGPQLQLSLSTNSSLFDSKVNLVVPIPEDIIGEAVIALEHLAWAWGLDDSDLHSDQRYETAYAG